MKVFLIILAIILAAIGLTWLLESVTPACAMVEEPIEEPPVSSYHASEPAEEPSTTTYRTSPSTESTDTSFSWLPLGLIIANQKQGPASATSAAWQGSVSAACHKPLPVCAA